MYSSNPGRCPVNYCCCQDVCMSKHFNLVQIFKQHPGMTDFFTSHIFYHFKEICMARTGFHPPDTSLPKYPLNNINPVATRERWLGSSSASKALIVVSRCLALVARQAPQKSDESHLVSGLTVNIHSDHPTRGSNPGKPVAKSKYDLHHDNP